MTSPSKKIILLVVVLALLGGLVFLLRSAKTIKYTAPATSVSFDESPLLAKDSDGDGLKDWEEELWKTDPTVADTDGDKTPDGQEIKSGRDPLVAGPNDKLDLDTIENKINTETENDLSDTTKFSRELFLKIIAAKKSNTPPTEEELATLLKTTIASEIQTRKKQEFSEGDFVLETAETPEKIRKYGNEIAFILTEESPVPLEHELIIVDRAQTKNDPDELKKLIPLIAQYEKIKTGLLKTVVPASGASIHVELTNAVSGMIYSLTALQFILTDPIKSLPGVSAYANNSQNFIAVTKKFKNYFTVSNVTFEQTDDGFNFFDEL